MGAAASRIQDIAEEMSLLGHDVTVVTEIPNYPTGIIHRKYRFKLFHKERVRNVKVIRTFVLASQRRSFLERMLLYVSFMISSMLGALFINGIDVVVATSPPLFVGISGYIIALVKRAKFVFDVRDLWPESAIALGELKNSFLRRSSVNMERFLYRNADKITIAVPGFEQKIAEASVDREKIWPITNVVDREMFTLRADRDALRDQYGWRDKFIVLFSGNHGLAQGLATIIEAARFLQSRQEIIFLFVGDGVEKPHLKSLKEELSLDQVLFVDQQPRKSMPLFISMSDVCLVPLKDLHLFDHALPSKMFEYMSCERPIIGSLRGSARSLIENSGAGLVIAPEDPEQLAEAIIRLYSQPDLRKEMGVSGRTYVARNYSRKKRAKEFEQVLMEIDSDGPAILR